MTCNELRSSALFFVFLKMDEVMSNPSEKSFTQRPFFVAPLWRQLLIGGMGWGVGGLEWGRGTGVMKCNVDKSLDFNMARERAR